MNSIIDNQRDYNDFIKESINKELNFINIKDFDKDLYQILINSNKKHNKNYNFFIKRF
jgi:hypothetical protein